MTTPQSTNADEIASVNLADEFADTALMLKSPGTEAIVNALLALGAQVAALRETLNRELPDLADAVHAARED
jgi:hypothetical protein